MEANGLAKNDLIPINRKSRKIEQTIWIADISSGEESLGLYLL